jgi:pimeloyl-ACP methyl ester carboxylesterase
MGQVVTEDGVRLHYEERGSGRPLVLVHGWCFSGRFFDRSLRTLAEHARVVTLDLRGHGDSDKPPHGYRIARLAKDLAEVLDRLKLRDATVLGWSLGCAVVWSHLELFGAQRLAGALFVAQTPRQYYGSDWRFAHSTCYDDAALASVQTRVELATDSCDRGQLESLTVSDLPDTESRKLLAEMAKSPPNARNPLLADHTRHDWRDLLPTIELPSLALVARQDRMFPWQGPAYVGQVIPRARTVFFENSGHALFLDEPDNFHQVVTEFLDSL